MPAGGPARPGATWNGEGTSFGLASGVATGVELCLFDGPESRHESRRVALERDRGGLWHTFVPGLGPGALYGYRVSGPHDPRRGHRFNPSKLLVDPYARAITGEPRYHPSIFGHDRRARPAGLSYNSEDSAPAMPRSVVVDPAFDWRGDRPPRVPWRETVIYEAHVKGMTRRHSEVEPRLRGTYLGLASPPVVEHLLSLGVTAVELLPVHQVASEPHLGEKGMTNYWGYSTLGFFAPHAGYATGVRGEQVAEFKTMVRELHRAGLEVILDVVYNHSAEGDHLGPTLCLRGVDNAGYYRLRRHDAARYEDLSGCGNSLDVRRPLARRLILDSLRYWVEEMHVDGFRFDLAPTLGRGEGGLDAAGSLLEEIGREPALAGVKLIAEPWDLGPGGYRLGRFPPRWAEWNDRFRDAARRFWAGDTGTGNTGAGDTGSGGAGAGDTDAGGELARRLAGSRDLFPAAGETSSRGIAYVTCHDGFTLADLVSYERKHNLANGEGGRDGTSRNLSRNWGHEGPSDDPEVRRRRERARRALIATLLLARGVPMLSHGDELGRSQGGNNNAYCQDNEVSWVDWSLDAADRGFLAFVRRLLELRRERPLLRAGPPPRWWSPATGKLGREPPARTPEGAFGMLLEGEERPRPRPLLVAVNGSEAAVEGPAPSLDGGGRWRPSISTADEDDLSRPAVGSLRLAPRSLTVFEYGALEEPEGE